MALPMQLVDFQGLPSLNEIALSAVFEHPNCRDRPVVVVSMAGDYRKGKSFMLNMFLKYLSHATQAKNMESGEDWLAGNPFEGFSSRGGLKRETTGILIWPEPFLVTLPSGEEVAVLVLDTQGTFDRQSTAVENTQIFALSTMISSIQIYNQSNNIQENHLQQLSLFVEYGAKALRAQSGRSGPKSAATDTPFQKLVLLVRDWCFEDDFTCDEAGGKAFLEDFLKVTSDQASELQVVRKQLKKCFAELDCFLLPQPGPIVEKGKPLLTTAALNADFRRALRRFVPGLLSPDRLMVKTSSGRRLTGAQLADYIRTYCGVLFSGGIPSPASMWRATAEVDHRLAMEEALVSFKGKMELIMGDENSMDSGELNGRIIILKREALDTFAEAPKLEDDDVGPEFFDRLNEQLDDIALQYLTLNGTRRELAAKEAAKDEVEARAIKFEQRWRSAEDTIRQEIENRKLEEKSRKKKNGKIDKLIEEFEKKKEKKKKEEKGVPPYVYIPVVGPIAYGMVNLMK